MNVSTITSAAALLLVACSQHHAAAPPPVAGDAGVPDASSRPEPEEPGPIVEPPRSELRPMSAARVVGCLSDEECDDGIECTIDVCDDYGSCVNWGLDADGDGFLSAETCGTDCDDGNAAIHPEAVDLPGDGVDANCDGLEACILDVDGDGYRQGWGPLTEPNDMDCDDPYEASANTPGGDCGPTDPAIHPGADDILDDGIDADCDGVM